jgi:hypothetical protein
MDEQDGLQEQPIATNVQLHAITPMAEGMSFGALLDKFYLSIEAATASGKEKDSTAQDFINTVKKSSGATGTSSKA